MTGVQTCALPICKIGQVLPEQHRPAGNGPREQVGNGLVFDLVGHQRRAVEHSQHGHDEPEDATEQEEEWDEDDDWDDDDEDEYDEEDEDDWEEDDDDEYFEDESDDSEEFDEFDSEAESDEPTPGWKVTPVFESVGDDEGSPHQGDPLPEDSADDEIKKIHEILKGLDEEQDAEDE